MNNNNEVTYYRVNVYNMKELMKTRNNTFMDDVREIVSGKESKTSTEYKFDTKELADKFIKEHNLTERQYHICKIIECY